MTYRTHDDGSISFPRRGRPPRDVPGYFRDPGDEFHFIPDFENCNFREKHGNRLPCGRLQIIYHCRLKNIPCSVKVCGECEEFENAAETTPEAKNAS
jgi:hypothetical protein